MLFPSIHFSVSPLVYPNPTQLTHPSPSLLMKTTTASPCHAAIMQKWESDLDDMMQGVGPRELNDERIILCPTCGSASAHEQGKLHALGSYSCPVQLQSPQPVVRLCHAFILDTSHLPIVTYPSPSLYTASLNPCSSCRTFHPPSTYLAQSCAPTVIRYPEISSSSFQRPCHLTYTPSYEARHCSTHCLAYTPHVPILHPGAAHP